MGWNKQYFVYLVANDHGNVLYVGMTNSLERRVWQHRHKVLPGFTKKYNCHRLVYFEMYDDVHDAIVREKQIKSWSRQKKHALIYTTNPTWADLAAEWYFDDERMRAESEASPESGDPSLRSG